MLLKRLYRLTSLQIIITEKPLRLNSMLIMIFLLIKVMQVLQLIILNHLKSLMKVSQELIILDKLLNGYMIKVQR